ncbi:MAG: [Fe-Fe] hydrogenase large subunit C-terminal domain-containing protein [Bacteroidota bacterium]
MNKITTNIDRDLIYTIRNKCRVCYTCVRECPAKAIKIVSGQAEVINERCVACGNCIKVCSQGAKVYLDTKGKVYQMLENGGKTVAIVAPSFPAEFSAFQDHKELVGMIRSLGFDVVSEVSFGADLVARRYNKLITRNHYQRYISSDCPAIDAYVERYHPALVDNLAPIASPMVAMSRVMREKYGDEINLVFIGPCIAKKAESDEVDEMITFVELREMFEESEISRKDIKPSEFDPPRSGRGAIFPVSRGLLQTAGIKDDVFDGNIIVAEGRIEFQEALKEFEKGEIKSRHLELLCCDGCIMGPGTSKENRRQYNRRILVHNYVQHKIEHFNKEEWKANIARYEKLDLSVKFEKKDKRITTPSKEEINKILQSMGKNESKDHLNCGACGYDTCEDHAIAIVKGLAETEMCLPYTIEKLHKSVKELAVTNEKLVSMQQTLKQAEKLASMGQLSAGIAHELNNPLGVVIMYANILLEEVPKDSGLYNDLNLIVEQTNRCKKIVGGLLNFARKNQVASNEVDPVKLVKQSFDAVVVPDQVEVNIHTDRLQKGKAYLDQEQMTQIFSNLFKNAIDAMPGGGILDITIEDDHEHIYFTISDTGKGIKKEDQDKIFEPFYTTKGIGKGTGLGLATVYGIVKMHNGKISLDSNADPQKGPTGTTFIISIPNQPEYQQKNSDYGNKKENIGG